MNDRMRTAMSELMSAVNIFGYESDNKASVVATFRMSHRTIQQCFVRLVILPILEHLGDCYNNGAYDGRNEASCRLAAKILAALNEDDTYLPYV